MMINFAENSSPNLKDKKKIVKNVGELNKPNSKFTYFKKFRKS